MKKKNLDSLGSYSEVQLKDWVKQWLKKNQLEVHSHALVFLEGEMGAGKSTLSKIFLSELGFKTETKGSPTFPLVQGYEQNQNRAFHIDLYRMKSEKEIYDSGIEETIENEKAWIFIEWASLFPEYFEYWFKQGSKKSRRPVFKIVISPAQVPEERELRVTSY